MKRLLAALFLGLVVALVGASGVASAAPQQDFVSGTGHFVQQGGDFDAQLHVNAQSGPTGDPGGHFFVTRSEFGINVVDFSGRVTCVNVDGNLAGVAGVVTKSKNPSVPVGTGFITSIVDGGPDEQDAAQAMLFAVSAPPTTCPFNDLGTQPTTDGNFVVHDATP